MQLIPTYFQIGEMAEVDQLTQTLETLNRYYGAWSWSYWIWSC